jgi:hypothetical protein
MKTAFYYGRIQAPSEQIEPRKREHRRSFERERKRVFLTDILIPYPLFPALAIRRRYLAFSHARDVERTQTIKRDSHSGNHKPKPPNQWVYRSDICARKGDKERSKHGNIPGGVHLYKARR